MRRFVDIEQSARLRRLLAEYRERAFGVDRVGAHDSFAVPPQIERVGEVSVGSVRGGDVFADGDSDLLILRARLPYAVAVYRGAVDYDRVDGRAGEPAVGADHARQKRGACGGKRVFERVKEFRVRQLVAVNFVFKREHGVDVRRRYEAHVVVYAQLEIEAQTAGIYETDVGADRTRRHRREPVAHRAGAIAAAGDEFVTPRLGVYVSDLRIQRFAYLAYEHIGQKYHVRVEQIGVFFVVVKA